MGKSFSQLHHYDSEAEQVKRFQEEHCVHNTTSKPSVGGRAIIYNDQLSSQSVNGQTGRFGISNHPCCMRERL